MLQNKNDTKSLYKIKDLGKRKVYNEFHENQEGERVFNEKTDFSHQPPSVFF